MSKPHKCPKCDGKGMLQYDPKLPFNTTHSSTGPWQCDVCDLGVLWEHDPVSVVSSWPVVYGPGDNFDAYSMTITTSGEGE